MFLRPMSDDLGWAREIFSLSLALQALVWGVTQPFAGIFADKYGPVRVLAFGSLMAACGFAIRGIIIDEMIFVLSGIIVGIGTGTCSFPLVIVALGKSVKEGSRSFIMGLGTAAGSVGMFVGAPLTTILISKIGWGLSVQVIAISFLLVLPLLYFVAKVSKPNFSDFDSSTVLTAVKFAFLDRSYILLFSGFFVCGFHVSFVQTHLPAYIIDEGLDPILGAWSIGFIGLFNIAGSFLSGWSGKVLPKQNVLSGIYATRAIVICCFVLTPLSGTSVIVFSAAMGLLWLSTVPLTTGLVAQTQGLKFLSTLVGLVFFSHQVGGFLGAWLGGLLYDLTGNYSSMWLTAIFLGILATIIHLPIRETPGPLARAEIAK